MNKIALIPSYEPDYRLIDLVQELYENNFEIIVVNDGSNYKYDNLFKSINNKSKVIEYKENKGKGYALKKGLDYIKNNYKECVIVTMDSDGQHLVKDAIKLCEYTIKNKDELVIGKRIRNEKTPIRSKIGNSITKIIYNITTGNNVYDTQTGLRCFHSNLIDYMLQVEGERYEYEMNMLLNLQRNNIQAEEIEIETIYIDNNSGSHFNTLKDSFRIYKEIFKFSLSSLCSFLIDYFLFIIFSLFINLTISNILARIISATFNYNFNKKIVFCKNSEKSAIKYILLAITILVFNTLILNGVDIESTVTSPSAFTTTEFLKLPVNVYVPASLIVKLLSYSLKLISLEFTV